MRGYRFHDFGIEHLRLEEHAEPKPGVGEIIVGIVQKSKVGKLLFGSTAQYVILNASCPVVTVK